MRSDQTKGTCYLVGAGPGDLGLFTLKAKELIQKADVIIYDYLANPKALTWAGRHAELIYVGKKAKEHTLKQDEINHLVVEKTRLGKCVVRLKGGDPYIFGRGGEEAEALKAANLSFEVVPGITAAAAATAYSGIPLSHREHTTCITFITGHEDPTKDRSMVNWRALVETGATLAIYMGMGRLSIIVEQLVQSGMSPEMSVGVIQWGSTPKQRSAVGTLSTIVDVVRQSGLGAPSIIIVGTVVEMQQQLRWFEDKSLLGQRMVVTRTRKQSSRMAALLAERGADVMELPTIRVEPIIQERNWLSKVNEIDWLVFTSPNAVDFFFEFFVKEHDIRKLVSVKIATVGPATAERVRAHHLKIDLQPKVYTAQGLVNEWKDQGAKILFPCSNLAKRDLEEGLKAKGSEVKRVEIYQTVPETQDLGGTRERLCREGADWVIFSSSSAVENFHKLDLSYPNESCRYASLGPVTSQSMKKLGYSVDLEASESTIDRLVAEIEEANLRK
ncbi:MAG: uroporphyrinogen-III C-methyltransferase [Verrucomicrobiota bacterium]